MFGKNEILKKDHSDGQNLRIVKGSPFYTIQGEGPYTGHPAIFIRLHGCHLACTFCDTNFSDPEDPVVELEDLVSRVEDLSRESSHAASIHQLVVITGGEPMRQDIFPLCKRLHLLGYKVQIETAGSFWIDGIFTVASIVVSPKTPMVHEMVQRHAVAFKYVINSATQFEDKIPLADTQGRGRPTKLGHKKVGYVPIYLSPMDEYEPVLNTANIKAVKEAALKYGYIAGVQLHKLLEVE